MVDRVEKQFEPGPFNSGVSNYIYKGAGGAQRDPFDRVSAQVAADIAKLKKGTWSVVAAVANSALLPAIQTPANKKNGQVSALRDFLSLYAVTQADGETGLTSPVIINTSASALFAGLISNVIIGGTGTHQNPYPNIHKVLGSLGIIPDSNVVNHNSHFHIYLNPPTPVGIDTAHLLLADASPVSPTDSATPIATLQTAAQGLLDYAQTITNTGDELMFTMDVPYVPAQDTPIVLAQAAAPGAGATPQPNYILKDCQEVAPAYLNGVDISNSGGVDPVGALRLYIQNQVNHLVEPSAITNITLLEGTSHGKLSAEVDNEGMISYNYVVDRGYLGNDRATFIAEFEGKQYKIVIDLHVVPRIDDSDAAVSSCPPPKLIKVNGKPVSGSSGFNLNSISVTVANLPNAAVGQTVGTAITLDTTAAGNGWYIDPNPAANTDFLPTSNPNVWIAAPGSAAAGKMDMLSVLLHEYGHALGLDHSANPNDFMAPDLQPGERRLPSTAELAMMSQLAAQLQQGSAATSVANSSLPAPTSPLAPALPIGTALSALLIGRLRRTDYGALSPVITSAKIPAPQFELAINSTLTNSNFAGGVTDWNAQGNVTTNSTGTATLVNSAGADAQLAQAFNITSQDRYIEFTVAISPFALSLSKGRPDNILNLNCPPFMVRQGLQS
ncbi:matrixin [mine drainage metagenome]|uniref:Matrixin n=1 Tax=mine drainage metagenome TaxID=410659 RepID=A0A1J5RZB4_9ZZZZ